MKVRPGTKGILVGTEIEIIDTSTKEGLFRWADGFEHCNKCVGKDNIGDVIVSTIFLGANYGLNRPEWFETMVFGRPYNGGQTRYETFDEACEGHKRILEAIRSTV